MSKIQRRYLPVGKIYLLNKVLPSLTSFGLAFVVVGILIAPSSKTALATTIGDTTHTGRGDIVKDITVPAVQSSGSTELWTQGFIVEGQPAYRNIIGHILDKAVFRSYRDSDIYYIFPAAGSLPTVKSARFKIVDQFGAYDGDVDLTLEIFDSATGNVKQVVAAADDDWLSDSKGNWVSMTLADATVQIGSEEFLAFHFHLNGNVGGDLKVFPEFEVKVTQPSIADLIEAEIISADTIAPLTDPSTVTSTQTLSSTVSQISKEIWRSGFTVEGTAHYEAAKGRLADTVAAVRAGRSVSDIYYLFPATPTKLVTVLSAKFAILEKSGSYNGRVKLSLEAHNVDGGSPRVISTETIDVKEIDINKWISIPLSTTPADVKLSPDDYLAAHFEFENGADGDFDIRPMFEVETAFIETDADDKFPVDIYVPVLIK
ncbi:MAG: hypothetical protein KDJ52_01605 [Anaerolineae bacterium]|nr:hypothetical protein [Anaerolineae bacterium]